MNKKQKVASGFSRRNFIRNGGLTATGFILAPRLRLAGNKLFFNSPDANRSALANDKLKVCDHAELKGFIGRKLDLSYKNRIMAQDAKALVDPFRHRTETHLWQNEFWGKWFTSAVLAYRYRPDNGLKKILQDSVTDLISTQTEDGYIGNYKKENHLEEWDIWGRKYCMLGLLDYADLTGDQASVQAAKKLADHLIKEIKEMDGLIVNKGNYRGMAASSVLEPIVRLYNQTGDKKYLGFAEEIVRQWEIPQGPHLISKANVDVSRRFPKPKVWYSYEQGQKAYEMMSCYEGLLELYRATGKSEYKQAVEATWNNILKNEINIAGSGASVETWFGGEKLQTSPVEHFQETCVTVTWIKLSQQLLRLTGEAKYGDAIEQSYYNALMGALSADGSTWAKYTPLNGRRLPGSGQCGMKLNCCVANGPRGQFTLPFTTIMSMHEGISINFFVEGSYTLGTPSQKKMIIIQKTDYPLSGAIHFHLGMEAPEEMTLRIRIPAWSRHTSLKVNGNEIQGIIPGEYAEIKRTWSPEDHIFLQLDLAGRVVVQGEGATYAAILKGPVVLARDTQLAHTNLGTFNRPIREADGNIKLEAEGVGQNKNWMQYRASFMPEAYSEAGPQPIQISLCDYASAGNGGEQSTFQVWMPQLYDPREH